MNAPSDHHVRAGIASVMMAEMGGAFSVEADLHAFVIGVVTGACSILRRTAAEPGGDVTIPTQAELFAAFADDLQSLSDAMASVGQSHEAGHA